MLYITKDIDSTATKSKGIVTPPPSNIIPIPQNFILYSIKRGGCALLTRLYYSHKFKIQDLNPEYLLIVKTVSDPDPPSFIVPHYFPEDQLSACLPLALTLATASVRSGCARSNPPYTR